jgi:A/G-specific adenine glycosylase
LLTWFATAQRPLPWRQQRSPYATWVSEIMLQQTQVATVVPYFERWMRTYPDVATLAQSQEQAVLKLWEGLGYYSRARSLLAGARLVTERFSGHIPSDIVTLRTIPGIGRYTAGAIASIGYRRAEPILDGNVMRVLCRFCDLEGDPRKPPLHEHLWELARQLVTNTDPSDLNESLMELGALVCTPKNPQCSRCPLRQQCRALADGHVELRPSLVRRTSPTEHRVLLALVSRAGRILVEQQPSDATRWAGLFTFPYWDCKDFDDPIAAAARHLTSLHIKPSQLEVFARGKYTITRFRFSFVGIRALVPRGARLRAGNQYSWVTQQQLLELPMPAPHRRVAQKL